MDLTQLAAYNLWANDITRQQLKILTEDEFSRDVLPPYGCIRGLVAHVILAIEYNKVSKVEAGIIKGGDLHDFLMRMSLEEMLIHWRNMDLWLKEFSSSHFDLKAVFPNFQGEGEIIVDHDEYFVQYLIHTVHHRAQMMSALRLMGKEAVGTDFLFYLSSLAGLD
jgi:uncharacterized damage-inducible protein DinB